MSIASKNSSSMYSNHLYSCGLFISDVDGRPVRSNQQNWIQPLILLPAEADHACPVGV